MKFRFQFQHDQMDCGPACLRMITDYYGKFYTMEYLRKISYLHRNGVSLLSLNDAAAKLGFKTSMVFLTLNSIIKSQALPCILHWNRAHFVVLYKVKVLKNKDVIFTIADPQHGIVKVDLKTFENAWISIVPDKGTALMMEPTALLYNKPGVIGDNKSFAFLLKYILPHKKSILQIFIGLLVVSIINLIFPFLTQILVDKGIGEKRLDMVYLVLASQFFLFLGSVGIEIFQNWMLLHINARISLNIISDFLKKLFDLPIRFFDTKSIGDITQRISDHNRVENFLTSTALTTFISLINILVFSLVLAFYSTKIILVFTLLSFAAISWIFLFQRKRKAIDYRRFNTNRENQDKLYEIIVGMPEIKLYGGEKTKRLDWERLQLKLFKLKIKSLSLEQLQRAGFLFLLQLKNIVISFIAASEVVSGNYSLGAMLSIAYIIGQTNGPLEQLISFFRVAQDARLSLNRMKEIHNKENEEQEKSPNTTQISSGLADIRFNQVYFQYGGPKSRYVLENISLDILVGKVNAIVGDSGSGKTTLMKLLLKFYECTSGNIMIAGANLREISARSWREKCGTVMQDGYIFSDTILKNIALDGRKIDKNKLEEALYISNLEDFIEKTPNGLLTRIGANGSGISGGQKQRLLIARAVYKNPEFIFFDEASSALDANNEKIIMKRLYSFFKSRTVVIIAHRLSTVKNADITIVIHEGKIVETGSHDALLNNKGYYFELVRNQLDIGKYECPK